MAIPFLLVPFPGMDRPEGLQLTGTIDRQTNHLRLHYRLTGNLKALTLPAQAPPLRQDQLWEHTCLELFLGIPNSQTYWEFNLSPAGHWNVYRFCGYRQGMELEAAISHLALQSFQQEGRFELELLVPLRALVPPTQPLEVGITAVIEAQNGSLSYWALTHPGDLPDFHRRDGFSLRVLG